MRRGAADPDLEALHEAAGVAYPPTEVAFIATKSDKKFEVWSKDATVPFRKIVNYEIRRASGTLGPKLREGDRQVPEGVYKIASLNPNSKFHLSMWPAKVVSPIRDRHRVKVLQ